MSNPRDQPTKWGVPVNPWTGHPITDQQEQMLGKLKFAVTELANVLHECEGSAPENYGYQTRRISIAGTHLEELQLMAMRELLDR